MIARQMLAFALAVYMHTYKHLQKQTRWRAIQICVYKCEIIYLFVYANKGVCFYLFVCDRRVFLVRIFCITHIRVYVRVLAFVYMRFYIFCFKCQTSAKLKYALYTCQLSVKFLYENEWLREEQKIVVKLKMEFALTIKENFIVFRNLEFLKICNLFIKLY